MAVSTITSKFYAAGGYDSLPGKPRYVSVEDAHSIIRGALTLFNRLTAQEMSVIIDDGELTTSDFLVNQIVAELACYLKDLDYAGQPFNVETQEEENRHWRIANDLILSLYGTRNRKGDVVLPIHADDGRACMTLGVVNSAD